MSMFNKLKEVKDMRDQAKQLQNQLSQESVMTSSEGGKINLVMDGNQTVVSLDINPELLTPDKKEELEKGLRNVFNEAVKKIQRVIAQKMQAGNFKMPNLG
ncbi:YbaB/EbfC family nucleoid-associated protein [Patescibacteria group bacterium]|nr:YbaB/EbfC family nucleoid-associated protein [Patescibacteria group bacterium]MBU1075326.1 YbaB/EbfC family nucleoid-associated protein [Patescibacteria group bacterium]MBU2229181.1 YbaB/EbfC family nucleoid-associated protein [Patescibacteria group bacterium]